MEENEDKKRIETLQQKLLDKLKEIKELEEENKAFKKENCILRHGIKELKKEVERYKRHNEYLENKINKTIDYLTGELIYPDN